MNNVREIARINERELELALDGAGSWHDDYKDSAYIFVGNLDKRLTEGDVLTVFSQYGEVLDINLPRIPEGGLRDQRGADADADARLTHEQRQQQQNAGKPGDRRGFGFLLFEDQRSTVLAVDNLNGFSLLGRTLRVDHVRDYKMPKRRNKDGEVEEALEPSRNAAPQAAQAEETAEKEGRDLDLEDPMAAYIARSKSDKDDDSREERRRRKEKRRAIREERERRRQRADGRSSHHRREDERHHRREDGSHHRSARGSKHDVDESRRRSSLRRDDGEQAYAWNRAARSDDDREQEEVRSTYNDDRSDRASASRAPTKRSSRDSNVEEQNARHGMRRRCDDDGRA